MRFRVPEKRLQMNKSCNSVPFIAFSLRRLEASHHLIWLSWAQSYTQKSKSPEIFSTGRNSFQFPHTIKPQITFFLILAHGDRCVLPLLHFSLGTQRALLSPSPHSGLPVSDSFICLYQLLPRLLWTHLSPHTPTIMLIKGLPHVRPRQERVLPKIPLWKTLEMQHLFCGQRTKLPAISVNKNVACNSGKQCIMPTSRPSATAAAPKMEQPEGNSEWRKTGSWPQVAMIHIKGSISRSPVSCIFPDIEKH